MVFWVDVNKIYRRQRGKAVPLKYW